MAADLAELESLAHASHSRVVQLEAQVVAHCDAAIEDVQRHEEAMDTLQQVWLLQKKVGLCFRVLTDKAHCNAAIEYIK